MAIHTFYEFLVVQNIDSDNRMPNWFSSVVTKSVYTAYSERILIVSFLLCFFLFKPCILLLKIEEKLSELLELMRKVRECWDMKKDLYEENWEIQLMQRELDQAEAWLTAKEGFLSDPSYGVSKDKDSINAT